MAEKTKNVRKKQEGKRRVAKKIHHQLIRSCVFYPEKKDDDYVYVSDIMRKTFSVFIFWKKRKEISIKDRLIGGLLK